MFTRGYISIRGSQVAHCFKLLRSTGTPASNSQVAQPDFLKKAMAAKDAPKVRAKKESEAQLDL